MLSTIHNEGSLIVNIDFTWIGMELCSLLIGFKYFSETTGVSVVDTRHGLEIISC